MPEDLDQKSAGLANSDAVPVRKPRFFKLVVSAFVALFVLVAAYAGLQAYTDWKARRGIEQLAEAIKRWEKENYERQLADTYGGKTPQETLRMYIEAVEKGDYELASKYFVIERQKKELESSNRLTKQQLQNYINLLRIALENLDSNGRYNQDGRYFSIYDPIFISMIFYPNGIWKIVEI
jgi:hypothetical protein